MQITRIFALATAATAAMAVPADTLNNIKDLDTCLEHAKTITHPDAATGWKNGCYVEFDGQNLTNLTQRSFPDSDPLIQKRCKDEHASCCCFQFCSNAVTCPACAAGCVTSCTVQWGGDCDAGKSDCGKCT